MKYILVNQPVPNRKLIALNNRIAKVNALPTLDEKKKYISKTNTWGLLKNWLSDFSGGNCWYCEAKTNRATGDVDHFRPKAKVTRYRKELKGHSGYYWLAYDWENYRYSCQRCNRPENDDNSILRGKANEFPLVDERRRKRAPTGIGNEKPKLLDPCVDDDIKLLAHLVNGCVEPAAQKGTIEYERAEYTRDTLGLNSFGVPKYKRDLWAPINLLIDLVGYTPQVIEQVEKKISEEAEYLSFFKAALRTHRDKDWIEELI